MFSSNTSQQSESYQIQRSLRFNRADSAYLNRTPASAGNRTTWTLSFWIKKSVVNLLEGMFRAGDFLVYFNSDTLRVEDTAGVLRDTTQVFRDYSAWYHFVITLDTPNATANDRIKVYVNGSQITSFSTLANPTQNQSLSWNNNVNSYIGTYASGTYHFGGYMTEVNFIDGQALTPSSFGQTNANTGVWEPKPYAGTYGTNGFYLNFSDNSNTTATTLGKDYSVNGNNWTPNNFSVSAGAGNDSLVDVPTPWGTDTGVGGSVRGNYCTLNPLFNATTLSNGNLDASLTSASITGTFGPSSGKWYFECTANTVSATEYLGIADQTLVKSDGSFSYSQVYVYLSTGFKGGNGSSASYGATWTSGDVIGVAYDLDVGSITFYKNGVSQGIAFNTGFTAGNFWRPFLYGGTSTNTFTFNFGQRPFAYTAPSGFKALCTQNLPTPTIGATASTQAGKFFNPVLYTGTGSSLSVTGAGFQPDFVWIKSRSAATDHGLYDVVRGVQKQLESNNTNAETTETTGLTAFGSDGFTVGALAQLNTNTATYVAWNWKANGAGVTNTAGSITSTVSANTTSGFSVVTFTATSGSGSIGHGLGVAPSMIILKSRSNTSDWVVYHAALGPGKYLNMNTTEAALTNTSTWQNTTPTSTVFYSAGPFATSWTEVAYCFAEVPGFSKFGSYTGNGSADGPFVYCGFRPRYIMFKASSTTGPWGIQDTARSTRNVSTPTLYANTADAEGGIEIDILSNGFKVRDTSGNVNTNGTTYIFAAFAEFPQKFSLAR